MPCNNSVQGKNSQNGKNLKVLNFLHFVDGYDRICHTPSATLVRENNKL